MESPLHGGKRVYRLISRGFDSYAAARLALREAKKLLGKARIQLDGVILHEPVG